MFEPNQSARFGPQPLGKVSEGMQEMVAQFGMPAGDSAPESRIAL